MTSAWVPPTPLPTKSSWVTPVTASLKVTVKLPFVLVVPAARFIAVTVGPSTIGPPAGGVVVTLNTAVLLPPEVAAPAKALLAESLIVEFALPLRLSVTVPVPVAVKGTETL
jgi:hypothetical protein